MITNKLTALCTFLFIALFTLNAAAQQSTKVTVRAKAKDAKFIGTSMGGAYVTIKSVENGQLLAEGVTHGSTGDTNKLMRESHRRYVDLSTEDAAKFVADISISEPTFVTVSAVAPGAQKQSQATVTTQLWLIPGKDITGDGIMLEIPGFAIDILQPQAHEVSSDETITITANAVMMCGCPISPDGMWDSNEMEFTAVISKQDQEVMRNEMSFTGKTSTFETSFTPNESGAYTITVFGYDPRTGNTGVDKTSFIIQ